MKDFIKKYIMVLCAFAVVTSCNKEPEELIERPKVEVEDPTISGPIVFDVRADESSSFKVGDTVKFLMEGNAEMVNFYSGAVGNDYAYRETDRFYDIIAKLSFESNKTPANASASNIDGAQLLYTTDFNGEYTYDNIKNVNWQPVVGYNLQTELQASNATYLPSGDVDVSDLFEEGEPVYFAWFSKTNAATNRMQFRVVNFTLTGEVVGNSALSSQLYSQGQFGFQWYENAASAAQASNRPTASSTTLTWNGTFNNMSGPYKEGYAVSGPIELPQFNAGKDKPSILLPKQNETEFEHAFIYDKPGNYEVVFIASNTQSNEQPEIIKKINITIAP